SGRSVGRRHDGRTRGGNQEQTGGRRQEDKKKGGQEEGRTGRRTRIRSLYLATLSSSCLLVLKSSCHRVSHSYSLAHCSTSRATPPAPPAQPATPAPRRPAAPESAAPKPPCRRAGRDSRFRRPRRLPPVPAGSRR